MKFDEQGVTYPNEGTDTEARRQVESENNGPRTHVFVLNYRGRDFLAACIQSLQTIEPPVGGWKCVVIDNDSDDGSVAMLRDRFPELELIRNEGNLGYAGGNNVGIRAAIRQGAEFVALLNMDLRVHPRWLSELVAAADANAAAALLGSRILTEDGRLVEFDGRQFDPVTTSGGYSYSRVTASSDRPYEAPYACGAALLLRLQALRDVGLFDPAFFAYHEDVDLALRCWLLGRKVLQVPTSIVYHSGGGAGAGKAFRDYMGARNSFLTVSKIFDSAAWRPHAPALIHHFLPDRDPARMHASLAALHMLPRTLVYRRNLNARAKVYYSTLMKTLEEMTKSSSER